MCRYAFSRYKPHYACFRCRKAYKRRLKADVHRDQPDRPARCPQCGLLMADMGLDFAPPPMRDREQWQTLERLWSVGVTFHDCGCGGPGYRPRTREAYRRFLTQIHLEFDRTLGAWIDRPLPKGGRAGARERAAARRTEAIVWWRERLGAVELALVAEGLPVPPRRSRATDPGQLEPP